MYRKFPSDIKWVVGVDEVGRGPVAGPVTVGVCACLLSDYAQLRNDHPNVTDSKKINPKKRILIAENLRDEENLYFMIVSSTAKTIDKIGIMSALRRALSRAMAGLSLYPPQTLVLLDGGLRAPLKYKNQQTIIRGDQSEWLIGAASILAKVTRDAKMIGYSKKHPQYNFVKHKGYGTKEHYQEIQQYGLSSIHRLSFCRNL